MVARQQAAHVAESKGIAVAAMGAAGGAVHGAHCRQQKVWQWQQVAQQAEQQAAHVVNALRLGGLRPGLMRVGKREGKGDAVGQRLARLQQHRDGVRLRRAAIAFLVCPQSRKLKPNLRAQSSRGRSARCVATAAR